MVDSLQAAVEVWIKTAELVFLVVEVTVAAVTVALDQVQETLFDANTGGGAGGGPVAVAGGSGVVIVKESIRQISGIWTMNDQYEYKKNDEWCRQF